MKKTVLKVISMILSMLFVMLLIPNPVVGAVTKGKCGDDLLWSLDDNGTLTISGKGKMRDKMSNTWRSMNVVDVIIKEGVTSIGTHSFDFLNSMKSVTIPSSVETIGERAFQWSINIESVQISEGVKEIEEGAFNGCTNLKLLKLPKSINSIGKDAFSNTENLTVEIPGNDVSFEGSPGSSVHYAMRKELLDKIDISALNIPRARIHTMYDITYVYYNNQISIKENDTAYGSQYIDFQIEYDAERVTPKIMWTNGTTSTELIPNNDGCIKMPESNVPVTIIISTETCISGYGSGFKWKLTDDGTLTIKGCDSFISFDNKNDIPWQKHSSDINKIVIEEDSLTEIDHYTFVDLPNLKEINIYNIYKSVELKTAWVYNCVNLETIALDRQTYAKLLRYYPNTDVSKYHVYYGAVIIIDGTKHWCNTYGSEVLSVDHEPPENQEIEVFFEELSSSDIVLKSGILDVTISEDKSKAYFTMPDCEFAARVTINYKTIQKEVTFCIKDGDKTIELQKSNVDMTTIPEYKGSDPTKDPTEEFTFTFVGWTDGENFYEKDKALPAVSDAVTYVAVFEPTKKSYEITFLDADGNEFNSGKYEYGQTPSCSETPTKMNTAENTYTFEGWAEANSTEVLDPLPNVTGEATYHPIFSETLNEYEITFLDEDGTELQSGKYEYGTTPSFNGTPTKPADDKFTYTFAGWTPELTKVTEDATYTAKFDANEKVIPPTPTPDPTPIVTPEPTPNPEVVASFEAFVERLYEVALGRESDPDGKAYWADQVVKGNLTGADCIKQFLLSEEFNNRNLSDEEFVTVLYKALFDRDAKDDPDGFNFWMDSLKTVGRESVVDGFINSTEWCNVCAAYGVKSGATKAKATVASKNATEFATRLYTECLGREPDEDGLKFWSLALTNLDITGTEAAHEFFYSAEFNSFNLSNTELVTKMYKTLLGREADSEGLAFWVKNMDNGMTKDQLFNSFADSPEFNGICVNYAIDR